MSQECYIVIGLICLFQLLDIVQLIAIKELLRKKNSKSVEYDEDMFNQLM